ncbi:MAG: ROK family transcriptional regulator [Candidatus Humimicrobiaceae bacterium]
MNLSKLLGKNVSELKTYNKIAIATLIERFGPITIMELSKRSSLSRATISNMLEELINEELVKLEKKDKSTGGRRPDTYNIIPNSRYLLGLSLGRFKVRGLLTDLKANIISEKQIDTNGYDIEKDVIPKAVNIVNELLSKSKEVSNKVSGIGISFPGTIDNITGEVYDSPNIGGVGINIKEIFAKYFDIPIFVENDANSIALAEWWFGSGKNKEFILYIFAGRGTGCGILINGEIYRGANKIAADVGHSLIDIDGRKCRCGNYGCVETYTSYNAMIRRFEENVKRGVSTNLEIENNSRLKETEVIDNIINSAIGGDLLSSNIISETGRILGIACANLVNLFDPEVVIIGGNLIKAGRIIIDPFIKMVKTRSKKITREKLEIIVSKLGPNPSTLGGIAIVLENFFQNRMQKGL